MDIINRIKLVLFNPKKFFSNLKEKTIEDALLYYIILLAINVVLGYIITISFGEAYIKTILNLFRLNLPLQSINSLTLIPGIIIGYIFGVLGSFVAAAIMYVWLLIFGGNKGYAKTYQLFIYSRTPSLLLKWIPFISFFTWIYDLVLLIIGTKKIYNFSTLKSILIYVIPLVLFLIIAVFFLIFALKNLGTLKLAGV